MRTQRTGTGITTITLTVIVIVLAASFAYCYASTTSQVSTLNSQVSSLSSQVSNLNNGITPLRGQGLEVCQNLTTEATLLSPILSSTVSTLQGQMQNDTSIITALNSTRPSGYEGMTSTLINQINQDQTVVNSIINFEELGISSGASPCEAFITPQ